MSDLPFPEALEALADDAGILFWVLSPDLARFRHLSPGLRRLWGDGADALLDDATPFLSAITPEDRAGILDGRLRPDEGFWAEPGAWEFRLRLPDGTLARLRARIRPVRGADGEVAGFAGLARVDTRPVRPEPRHDPEEQLEAVFRALPDLVLVIDEEGRYLRVVSGDRSQLYRPEEELSGRTFHEVFDPPTAAFFLSKVREALDRDDRVRFRYSLEIDGRTEWFDAIAVPMQRRRVLWVARTITDRVELEEQLAHATRLDALGQLAGGVAHDFNNVITVIQGTASLMAETVEDPGLVADLADIRSAAERASSLTRHLLAFSRQQVLKPERVSVSGVIERMGRMLARVIGEHIELAIETPDAGGAVMIDQGQLEHVVVNLVVNARQAIDGPGSIRIVVEDIQLGPDHELVETGALGAGSHVSLRVEDSGSGMEPEVLQQAFDPFFTTKPAGQGTGLGLSMVYGTVHQSGGHVDIRSSPGEGTTVRILLPVAPPPGHAEPRVRAPAVGGRSARVLVVEDEAPVREVVRRFLEGAGHEVESAADGAAALDRLRNGPDFDLVLSDLVMPRLGGVALMREIRESRPGLPVILMSGYTGPDAGDRADALDAEAYLTKPFGRAELLRTVREILNGD